MLYNPTNLRLPAVLSTPEVKSIIYFTNTGASICINNGAAIWSFFGGAGIFNVQRSNIW